MSGGSFNYLCDRDAEELFQHSNDVQYMVAVLTEIGATDAAKETESLLLILRQFEVRTNARIDRLKKVWHAVEWWKSCDWGKDRVDEALAGYRGEQSVSSVTSQDPGPPAELAPAVGLKSTCACGLGPFAAPEMHRRDCSRECS